MKAFVVFYNILKNEGGERWGTSPNFKLKLAGQILGFFSRLSRFLVPPFGLFSCLESNLSLPREN